MSYQIFQNHTSLGDRQADQTENVENYLSWTELEDYFGFVSFTFIGDPPMTSTDVMRADTNMRKEF